MHSTSKALMGAPASNHREVSNYPSIAGVALEAGLAVVLEASGKVSLDSSEGVKIGISLGKDLSDLGRTVVCHKGLRVPIKLKASFDPVVGAQVQVETDTGLALASGTAVNAVYATGRLGGTGVTGGIVEGATTETGSVGVALIDFPGGL